MKTRLLIIVGIIGFSLFILGMTFVIPGGDRHGPDVDLSKLHPSEACIRLSGEQGWNEVENSCLFFSGNINDVAADQVLCRILGGHMKGDVQYTDVQDKTNTAFIECQFPIEIIDT